jgi:hypothetical protein
LYAAALDQYRRAAENQSEIAARSFIVNQFSDLERERSLLQRLLEFMGNPPAPWMDVVGRASGIWRNIVRHGHAPHDPHLRELLELEQLLVLTTLKRQTWQLVSDFAPADSPLDEAEVQGLIRTADARLEQLKRHHQSLAASTFRLKSSSA